MLFATATCGGAMGDVIAKHRHRPLLADIAGEVAVRHRPTEADAQQGAVGEVGGKHDLRLLLHERLIDSAHDLAASRRNRGLENLDELHQSNIDVDVYDAGGEFPS